MGYWVRRGVRFVGWGGALAVSLGAHTGWAFRELVQVEWRAPLECPQGVNVEEGVRHLLGADDQEASSQGSTPGSGVRFSGTMRQLSEGLWKLELRMNRSAETRTRELTGASCHELTEAGVAVIALALSDTAREPNEPNEPNEPGSPEPVPLSSAQALPAPQQTRGAGRPPTDTGSGRTDEPGAADWGAHAAMVTDLDMFRDSVAGVALGATWGVGAYWFSARAIYLPPERAATTDGSGARVSLFAGNLTGCYGVVHGTFAAGPCLQVEAGVLPTQTASDGQTPERGPWAAVGAGLAARWALGRRWRLLFDFDVLFPFLTDGEDVYLAPVATGRTVLGLEVRFP